MHTYNVRHDRIVKNDNICRTYALIRPGSRSERREGLDEKMYFKYIDNKLKFLQRIKYSYYKILIITKFNNKITFYYITYYSNNY